MVDVAWNPVSPRVGDAVTFSYTIKNQGTTGTTRFTTALYIDGQRIDISARISLGPSESRTGRFTYQWKATTGSHRVTVVADDLGEIAESNEDNNAVTKILRADSGQPTPSAPTLGDPSNGATVNTRTPTFTWNAISDALAYQMQVSTEGDFWTTVFDRTTSATSLGSPVNFADGTYYWLSLIHI